MADRSTLSRVCALVLTAALAAACAVWATPAAAEGASEYVPGAGAPPVPPLQPGGAVTRAGADITFGDAPPRFAGSRAARSMAERIASSAAAGPRAVVIEGYTDTSGTLESSWSVAAQRAVYVRNALQAELNDMGVRADLRFVLRAFGESYPSTDGAAPSNRVAVLVAPVTAAG